MQHDPTPSTLFEILRSFTTLASTLNLSETVQRLGVTRQTVRRHINTLEELKGAKLFELRNRSYSLTDAGMQCRLEAQAILDQTEDWLRNKSVRARSRGALERVTYKDEKGYSFHAQQHHLGRLWVDAPPLLRRAFEAWSQAELQLEYQGLPPGLSAPAEQLALRRGRRVLVLCHLAGLGMGQERGRPLLPGRSRRHRFR